MLNIIVEKEQVLKAIPEVLIKAKKEADIQAEDKEKTCWNNGPWDEGHWANRT